jgi:FkbM family methyltransferase
MNYSGRLDDIEGDYSSLRYPTQAIVSYAQNREDVLLWRALHAVEDGFYVDVGAHDPSLRSVTRAFYEKGWSGLNIEPDPRYAEKLREARSRDTTLQVAIGRMPGRKTLFDFGDSGLSTTQPGIAIDSLVAGMEVGRHEVEVKTLAAVLAEAGRQPVHFLKIDVEGSEADVLAGADFAAVRPWIILVEAIRPVTLEPSHAEWEPILLDADYVFAYFDGLNRFYVAREQSRLLAAFSVPVSINDPFEDAEAKRRDAQLAALRATAAERQEAPRLAFATEIPVAAAIDDAAGLLRVVEAQAVELGRTRRALVAARALAEERMTLLRSQPSSPLPAPEPPDQTPPRDLAELRGAVLRAQSDIADVLFRSRWRRLGLRLRLARRAPWESGDWSADPALLAPAAATTPDVEQRLWEELRRLRTCRGDLGRSRWRKLGQALGLAKRLPWEMVVEPPPQIPLGAATPPGPPVPAVAGAQAPAAPAAAPPASDYAGFVEYTSRSFLAECRRAAVDVILDVGANAGQFGAGLREVGYQGRIISFEPLSRAHAALSERAAEDVLWTVAPRCALGAAEGEATIHVAGNSYSSSLLPMLESHRSAAPESAYVDRETCPVLTLDGVIEASFADPSTSFGLKMDTQGFEGEVLKGLARRHRQVEVILCEMSLTPLYEGAPTFFELCQQIADLGFRCVALGPEFADPKTGLLLQVNGVFVRDPHAADGPG